MREAWTWLVNFAYSISTNYSMGMETLLGHGEKKAGQKVNAGKPATWEARDRPEGVFVQISMGLLLLDTTKKIPRTMSFPIISCRYLSGSETGIKGSG